MKKLMVWALLMMLCLLPLGGLAEMDEDGNVVIALDGAEVFFTPVEGYCLTRESSASDYNRLGLSQWDVVMWMEEYDVYALMFDEEMDGEYHIAISPTTEMDFDELTAYGQEMLCETLESTYRDAGYTVERIAMYHTPAGHSYVCGVVSYTYADGTVERMVEFYTCQSGYAVFVLFYSYGNTLTEEQYIRVSDIADSLWLSEVTPIAQMNKELAIWKKRS